MFSITILLSLLVQFNIYNIVIKDIDGSLIRFDNFRDKKIMLVNIGISGEKVSQIRELQALQNKFKNSLVVIGLPSQSFGVINKTKVELKSYYRSNFGAEFLLAEQVVVKGNNTHELYKWLTDKKLNGVFDSQVNGDFQKYIVDERGSLVAVFSGSVSPVSDPVIDAIQRSYN